MIFKIALIYFIWMINGYAAQPLMSVVALYKPPTELASNRFSAAIYQLTNNSKVTSFIMQPIKGLTQVTNLAGACQNPIQLGQHQSCQLFLRFEGSQMNGFLNANPVICPTGAGGSCSRPNLSDSIHLRITPEAQVQNNWISVLVADNPPPTDLSTYMNKIIALAPNLKQIHVRFLAGGTNYSTYADLINLFHTAYGTSLMIGFHPDASSGSYGLWGCADGNWQCVLNATIIAMNAIDAIADPSQKGIGFTIYSVEQSYIFPVTLNQTYRDMKACLNPTAVIPGPTQGTCPASTIASKPYVKFGSVLPSYGDCGGSTDCQYGSDALDYGYPQYYNLGKQIGSYTNLITNGFFPSYTTACQQSIPQHLYVVDEDNGSSPYNPQIPCNSPANAFVYKNPSSGETPDVSVATAYVSYLMTQLPPISNIPNTNGATVYLTFSGEGPAEAPSLFLGAPGWTLNNILEFYTGINTNLNTLYAEYPPPNLMFKNGIFSQGINPNAIQYGIWNYDSILANE